MSSPVWTFSDCRFDARDGSLVGPGGAPALTLRPQVARLLIRFLEQPGEIIDRESLIAAVWDEGRVVDFESGLAALLRELRSALDQVGAGAELVETVPRRGYRFLAQVETGQAASHRAGRVGGLPRWALSLAGLAALGLVAGLFWISRPVPEVEPVAPTLAIIPFERYGGTVEDDRRIELLMADTILARLWRADLEELVLIGRATLRPYEGRDDVAAAVARDLDVQLLIEGSVLAESDGNWRVNARLLAMPAGSVLWSSNVEWQGQPVLPVPETADLLVAELAEDWPRILASLGLKAVSE